MLDAYIKKFKLTPIPAIILAHDTALILKPSSYPLTEQIKAYRINAGSVGFNIENIYHGMVPTQVYVLGSMLQLSSYLIPYPYLFHHYNLSFISLYVDDESVKNGIFYW